MSALRRMSEEDFALRVERAYGMLQACRVCPRTCGVNRLAGEKGYCGAGVELEVSSFGAHFGEEDVLVGYHGSGTIFLTGCSLRCVFCQNYDISQLGGGHEVSIDEFADIMLRLQSSGCHNVNLVTPTHFTPQIIKAIGVATRQGLSIPIVYNCGGYESVETLRLLDGIIDIYMPDAKYADPEAGARLSDAPDYPDIMRQALREMHRQVGDLVVEDGLAVKGLLVRHLVLPDDLAGTEAVMRFIATDISTNAYVNVMDQYRPVFRAGSVPAADRRPTKEELDRARLAAAAHGLRLAR